MMDLAFKFFLPLCFLQNFVNAESSMEQKIEDLTSEIRALTLRVMEIESTAWFRYDNWSPWTPCVEEQTSRFRDCTRINCLDVDGFEDTESKECGR